MNGQINGYERAQQIPEVRPMPSRKAAKKHARRRRRRIKWLTVILLTVLLIALGIYYVGQYRHDMEYLRYPLRHEQIIVRYADEFDLEAWHVAAVVRCESSFRETATSEVGARGLMQIMPDTGSWLAGKFAEKDIFNADMLYQPETNVKYGCWYLNWLMDIYDEDLTLVTAAYHAGHGTVNKWLKDASISPDGKTLSKIPYNSTRTYVERVLTACEKYRTMYDFDQIRQEISMQ